MTNTPFGMGYKTFVCLVVRGYPFRCFKGTKGTPKPFWAGAAPQKKREPISPAHFGRSPGPGFRDHGIRPTREPPACAALARASSGSPSKELKVSSWSTSPTGRSFPADGLDSLTWHSASLMAWISGVWFSVSGSGSESKVDALQLS